MPNHHFILNAADLASRLRSCRFLLTLLACSAANLALADSAGFLGIDHRLNRDDSGIWARSNQTAVGYGSALAIVGGALYEGSDSRLGRTYWRSLDAMLLADVSAAVAKSVFRRQRPEDGNDPNGFFKGRKDRSFPSGEMTHISAVVTPFILEYRKDTPSIWLLAVLPAYVGIARLKSQAHWQSDILAGGALGAGMGYLASQPDQPWSVSVLPRGLTVGYKMRF